MVSMGRWVTRQPDGRVAVWRLTLAAGIVVVAGVLLLALWTHPPDWLEPTHRHLVGTAGWMREHWLNAVAITAWGTVLLAAVAIVPFASRRSRSGSEPASDRMSRERAVMLHQVRYKWIAGVLEPSLADAARIVLGLKPYPDVLDLGTRVPHRVGQPPESFPEGTTIGALFEQVGSGLLILGKPGAGKTTLLLQLTDELLERAERDLNQPIPVVFHLSSWAAYPKPLEEWLARELTVNYDVPAETATAWLKQGALTLLLDGLDEVSAIRRAACAQAINDFRHKYGLVPIAVCSRTEELEHLAVRLRLHEAVELQPPTNAEIDRYLSYIEATGTPLADIRAAVTTDESLRELLRSPLMLHVIALAYHGRTASALEAPGTSENRREQLWRAYTIRMFEQRPLGASCTYTSAQAIRWLSWLARCLYNLDETEFHLDSLSGRWLPSNRQRLRRRPGPRPYDWTLTTTDAAGQKVSWPPADRRSIRWAWWLGHVAHLIAQPAALCAVVGTSIVTGLDRGALAGIIAGLACAMGTIICAIRLNSLNQQMWRSERRRQPATYARYASIAGAFAALFFGILYGSAFGLTYGPFIGLLTGAGSALVSGLLAWLNTGGDQFLRHVAARAELVRADVAPRKLPLFLEAMTERQLLRRSGDAYLFIHRMLRDLLATADLDDPLDAEASINPQPPIRGAASQ